MGSIDTDKNTLIIFKMTSAHHLEQTLHAKLTRILIGVLFECIRETAIVDKSV